MYLCILKTNIHGMKTSEFFRKFASAYLWLNLLGMAVVVVVLALGVKYGLDLYTHHGEALIVPNVKHKACKDAERILDDLGLVMEVSDTGYVKSLPPDCILEQSVMPGERVKSGRIVYVTINAPTTPTITLPDVIDNSSLREAMAKLSAIGFKLGMPEFVPGERDWVYGITVKGRHVATGDKISIEDELIIQVGNGQRDMSDSVDYIDPVYPIEEDEEEDGFEVVDQSEQNFPEPAEPLDGTRGEEPPVE